MTYGGWQRVVYRAGWSLLAPVVAPFLAWHPRLKSPLRERLGRLDGAERGAVWLHGSSAGDVRALAPIATALERGGAAVVMTASTSAGRELGAREGGRPVWALPLDHPLCVGRALDDIRPRALVLEARELWPELVLGAAERGIPCVVVDARVSDRSARTYARFRGLCGPLLAAPACFCAVDEGAAAKLAAIGVDPARIRITGDVKIEATLAAADAWDGGGAGEADESADARIVLGSVHAGEGRALLQALVPVVSAAPASARFELVARYPAEGPALRRAVERAGLAGRVDVAAELGILRRAYRGACAAFVGGSLVDRGGHNVVEPAAEGTPFVIGPSARNARAALAVLRGEGVVEARTAEEVAGAIGRWLADPAAARRAGRSLRTRALAARGALDRTLTVLRELGLPS